MRYDYSVKQLIVTEQRTVVLSQSEYSMKVGPEIMNALISATNLLPYPFFQGFFNVAFGVLKACEVRRCLLLIPSSVAYIFFLESFFYQWNSRPSKTGYQSYDSHCVQCDN